MFRAAPWSTGPANQGAQVAILGSDNKVTLKFITLGRDFGEALR
jgi:hypothetical protein